MYLVARVSRRRSSSYGLECLATYLKNSETACISRSSKDDHSLTQIYRGICVIHSDFLLEPHSSSELTQTTSGLIKPTGVQPGAVRPWSIPKAVQRFSNDLSFSSSDLSPPVELSRTTDFQDRNLTGDLSSSSVNQVETHHKVLLSVSSRHRGAAIEPLATSTLLLSQEPAKTPMDQGLPLTTEAQDYDHISLVPAPCGAKGIDGIALNPGFNLPQHEAPSSGCPSISPGSAANQTSPNMTSPVFIERAPSKPITKASRRSPPNDSFASRQSHSPRCRKSLQTPSGAITKYDTQMKSQAQAGKLDVSDSTTTSVSGDLQPEPVFIHEDQTLEDGGIDGEISLGNMCASMDSECVNSALAREVRDGLCDSPSLIIPDAGCMDDETTDSQTPASQVPMSSGSLGRALTRNGRCLRLVELDDFDGLDDETHEHGSEPSSLFLSPLPRLPSLLSTLEDYAISPPTAISGPPPFSEHVADQAHAPDEYVARNRPPTYGSNKRRYDVPISSQDPLKPVIDFSPGLGVSQWLILLPIYPRTHPSIWTSQIHLFSKNYRRYPPCSPLTKWKAIIS
ncbi:hypothetical protein FPV67DRAFT_1447093 [Lyophyllum atratum]|nr:hypothetical protein FPV67DRAFT_1447093 [Lyophyllum atratum]